MDDQEDYSRLVARQTNAVATLIRDYQDLVVNTCYGFLHNRPDAEDAAQEVFLKAWQALPGFRGESKLSTWLYRIAVRTSLDILRKRKREGRWAWLLCMVGFGPPPASGENQKDPLVELERRERAKVLMAAIDNLPEQQRVAYVLATFDGVKGKEIAEIMETTLSAVEALLHRARGNLRRELRGYYGESPASMARLEEKEAEHE